MRFLLNLFILILLPMSLLSQSSNTTIMNHNSQAAGLWGFDFQQPAPDMIGNHPTSIMNFLLEDGFLTIRLMNVSGMPEPDADEFFKLRTKWDGAKLFYLAPGGSWQPFAFFKDNAFEMIGMEKSYHFKRITNGEIKEWNASLLREDRPPYVYDSE